MNAEEPKTDIDSDVRLCHAALAGQIGAYEAAKTILANHSPEDPWCRDIPEAEILFDMVAEMEREIPRDPVRQHWDPEALAQRDNLAPWIEERYREKARAAFQAIIDLWQPWLKSRRGKGPFEPDAAEVATVRLATSETLRSRDHPRLVEP